VAAVAGVESDALDFEVIADDLSSLLAMFENAETVETRRVRVILAGGVKILTAGELVAGAVSPRVAWPLQHRALAHHQQIVERTRRRIPREKRYRYKPS
jgi:hypothetical protein